MASIYGLYDHDGNLRYIGKANDVPKRLASHMRDARRRKTPLYDWINKHGLPEVRTLHVCSDTEDWRDIERALIASARERGERLLNLADGGDEPFCPIEVRIANGRKSAGSGYLANVKNDRFEYLIFRLKRESHSLLRFYQKRNDAAGEQRMLEKMRRMHERLPQHFPRWAAL